MVKRTYRNGFKIETESKDRNNVKTGVGTRISNENGSRTASALSLSKTLELARTFGMIRDQAKKMAFYRKLKGRDSRRTYP